MSCVSIPVACDTEVILLKANQKFGVPAILEEPGCTLYFTHECLPGRPTFLMGLRQSLPNVKPNLVMEHEFREPQILNWALPGAPVFRAVQVSETRFLLENARLKWGYLDVVSDEMPYLAHSLRVSPLQRWHFKLPAKPEPNSVLQLHYREDGEDFARGEEVKILEIPLIPGESEDDTLSILNFDNWDRDPLVMRFGHARITHFMRWNSYPTYELNVSSSCLLRDQPCETEVILLRGNKKFRVPVLREPNTAMYFD